MLKRKKEDPGGCHPDHDPDPTFEKKNRTRILIRLPKKDRIRILPNF